MRLLTFLTRVFVPALLVVPSLVGQNIDEYRSVATGVWGTAATWERYTGSAWTAAATAPDSSAAQITIQAAHTVTIAADVVVDSLQVLGTGHLVINAGVTVTVAANGGLMGIDVDSTGSVTVNGTIVNLGSVSGAIGSYVFNDGAVYDHARNGGSVPRSTWNMGSTFRLSGVTANSPSNTNQDFYHIEIDNVGQTSNLNLAMSGNTIGGNIYVVKTGASNRYYLTNPTAHLSPITIEGDIIQTGGQFSTNGSSSAGTIVAHVYGDVFVSAGNFGSSRGSGTIASWIFHGDTVSFSNATLQNSTSSATKLQKFVFAKQGVQVLRMTNVAYGSSTSPITFQVSAGTTLDIDTVHIPNNCTGSFILDSGATLTTVQNAGGNSGNIECLADYGGGNSFVNIFATAGSGTTSVTATKGAHPNAFDAAKSLQRYWTLAASESITASTLTFYYFDVPTATASEVMGTETAYKALKYAGMTNEWYTNAGSTVDDIFDFVTATNIRTVTGVWSVGEATPAPTTSIGTGDGLVPIEFAVSQNFPNPFNPSTKITFDVPTESRVTLEVFDLLGRNVETLFDGIRQPGRFDAEFEASRLPSGIYIYRLNTPSGSFTKRMVLMK